jgi:hypothetical protein
VETVVQLGFVLLLCALPAIAAAWFTERGGDVLAHAFRPMSGQKFGLEEAWPQGVQEEEPRPWGSLVTAPPSGAPDTGPVAPSDGDRLPRLQRVRRGTGEVTRWG